MMDRMTNAIRDRWQSDDGAITLILGDCLEILPTLEAGSVDAVVTDPPYAEIDRDYGRMTEPEWHAMMDVVVPECRRCLCKDGSAVFVLQPNSERVGRMRPWLWEFMAKWSRDWNMVQDAWWWNHATPPTVHCHEANGLMRPSLKACVWLGPSDCYRNQEAMLLPIAEATTTDKRIARHELGYSPSGLSMRHGRALTRCAERGGATPFNLLVCANSDAVDGGGAYGHGAATPYLLAERWVKYLSRPEGCVLDMFAGSGTTGVACIRTGRRFIGIELEPKYFAIAVKRCKDELARMPLFKEETRQEWQRELL